MPPVCPLHGPSCPLPSGGKVCICCYFFSAIGALSGSWVLLEARVSLLAVPRQSSEVKRLYKLRWWGFLFLLMPPPSPSRDSSCHNRLGCTPTHYPIWLCGLWPPQEVAFIFCEGMALPDLCLAPCCFFPAPTPTPPSNPLHGTSSLVSPCHLPQEASHSTSPLPVDRTHWHFIFLWGKMFRSPPSGSWS